MPPRVAPAFNAPVFNCPHCDAYASQRWRRLAWWDEEKARAERALLATSTCAACEGGAIWRVLDAERDEGMMLFPSSTVAALPHPDMPEDVAKDFKEAAAIALISPRGAAALLRLSVQKLMISLGMPGQNINADIGQLVKEGLPAQIQQALDYCRVVGNNAVHPGEMDLQDSPELVSSLFDMINMIVDYRIAQPKRVQELFAKMPPGALAAIERRDDDSDGKR